MKYTVIGVYREPLGQRYATTIEADSPEEAEVTVTRQEAGSGLIVAAVVEGEAKIVDVAYTDGLVGVPR